MEAKEKILISAGELFMQFGIRSVTMDDVAKEASMSKKTLYQYFENKDKLVTEVVNKHIEDEKVEFEQIKSNAKDAIEEIVLVSKCLRKHVVKTNPALLLDMQKYYGRAWSNYLEFKNTTIRGQIKENISRGIAEGCFRKEIDPEILATFRVEHVHLLFNPKLFPNDRFDFPTVQLQVMDHFIYGLLTDEGRIKYLKYNQL